MASSFADHVGHPEDLFAKLEDTKAKLEGVVNSEEMLMRDIQSLFPSYVACCEQHNVDALENLINVHTLPKLAQRGTLKSQRNRLTALLHDLEGITYDHGFQEDLHSYRQADANQSTLADEHVLAGIRWREVEDMALAQLPESYRLGLVLNNPLSQTPKQVGTWAVAPSYFSNRSEDEVYTTPVYIIMQSVVVTPEERQYVSPGKYFWIYGKWDHSTKIIRIHQNQLGFLLH